MEIIIVRHGETMNNLPDPALHSVDPDLNPLGREQARLLGERLAGVKIDALISSPLLRALRTAHEISARKNNMPVHICHDLVEIGTDYAVLSYQNALEICPAALPYEAIPAAGDYGDGYGLDPGDPYYTLSRAYRVISRVRQSYPEGATVVLVGHGAFNQRLIAAALRFPFPPNFVFSQDNTGLSVVSYRPGHDGATVTRLAKMNDTSHLYGAASGEKATVKKRVRRFDACV